MSIRQGSLDILVKPSNSNEVKQLHDRLSTSWTLGQILTDTTFAYGHNDKHIVIAPSYKGNNEGTQMKALNLQSMTMNESFEFPLTPPELPSTHMKVWKEQLLLVPYGVENCYFMAYKIGEDGIIDPKCPGKIYFICTNNF